MTPERLREIQERAEKATKGPWFPHVTYGDGGGVAFCVDVNKPAQTADMHFIHYARQDIPDLLTEVDRLKAELAGAYERAAKGLTTRARLIRDDEAFRMSWAGPDPRGPLARDIRLTEADYLENEAAAIRKLGETP
jgi:hypothetical protein